MESRRAKHSYLVPVSCPCERKESGIYYFPSQNIIIFRFKDLSQNVTTSLPTFSYQPITTLHYSLFSSTFTTHQITTINYSLLPIFLITVFNSKT
jgi:hypothetical protein